MNKQNTEHPGRFAAIFYIMFTVLAFSSIEIMVNPIRHIAAPNLINFWRFLIGCAILFPFMLISKRRELQQLKKIEVIKMGLLGCFNILIIMGAHALCIKYARASTAAVLISANPLATNFFSWLILKESMSGKRILALLTGLAGIILLTWKADTALDSPLGIGMGIFAMTGFGLYTVISKKMVQKHGSIIVLVISTIPALVLYLPVLYFTGSGFIPVNEAWPGILGAGIIGTGLGYLTFMKALQFLPAGRASYLFFFKPPVAILMAWLFLGETLSLNAAFGILLIMSGIIAEALSSVPKK